MPSDKISGKRILLMDDDLMVLDIATQILDHLGYYASTANSKSNNSKLFFEKYQKIKDTLYLLLLKIPGGNRDCNNIVKSMCSGRNSKAAKCEKNRKINPCDRPKSKPCKIKRVYRIRLPAEKIYMVDGMASFTCPVCSQRKTENVRQYLKQKTVVEIVSTCSCGHTWTSVLERRRHFRKPVKLRGRYTFRNDVFLEEGLAAGSFVGKGKMKVVDLSLKGLRIELKNKPELHVNDFLSVEFRLKDKNRTLIIENASVKSINGRFVGSAFGPDVTANTSLGFYLLT